MGKRRTFKERIYEKRIMVAPGAYDAFSAKLVEHMGFEALYITGAGISASLLGEPDVGLVTMTEQLTQARYIVNAVNIPVICDADTGYGNPINVIRTVTEFEKAGVAAIHLEDQEMPKRCGHLEGKRLVSKEEMVQKIRATIEARKSDDFVIMARTDARTAVGGSLEETIQRAKAYREEGGVDVIYVEALQSREEIKQVRSTVDGPLACSCWALQPHPSLHELQEMGMCMTLGIMFFEVGFTAWWDMLVTLKQKGIEYWAEWREKVKDHPMSWHHVYDLTGFPKVRQWEEKYLPKEQLDKYDKSIGLYEPSRRS